MSLSRFSSDTEYANKILSSLTENERGYFIACTDIFHDKQYNVNGRPSVSSQLQNTVVLNLTKTVTGSDFGAVGNWDVNIFSLPFITSQVVVGTLDTGFTVESAAPAAVKTIGGVTFVGADTGTPLDLPTIAATNVTNLDCTTAIFPDWNNTASVPIARQYYQILSMGIEIINATPELYRGGNVIRYRVPTQGRAAPIAVFGTIEPYSQWPNIPRENFRCYPIPPSTPGLASQYPDSVIDEAVEGSYQMHTLQDNVSDFYVTGNERVFFSSPNPPSGTIANSLLSASVLQGGIDYDPPLARGDFDIVGSYFTGLTPQSILTVRYRVVMSQVPSSSDSFLSSLSKMSPSANEDLDMLISKVQNEFLPGIRAGLNPAGEWWKTVVKGLGKVAKATGKSALKTALNVGIREGQMLASAVSPEAGHAFNYAVAAMQQERQKQRQKQQSKSKVKPKPGPRSSTALINSGKA